MEFDIPLTLSLLGIALFNAFATYRLSKSILYTPLQKLLQGIMIWALPVLGGALSLAATSKPEPAPIAKGPLDTDPDSDRRTATDLSLIK